MDKYIRIPVTNEGSQLVQANDIKLIEQASTTTVTLTYGGAAAQDIVTLTLGAAMAANDVSVRDAVQDAMITALQTGWTSPKFRLSLAGLEDAAGAVPTITGIAIA